MHCHWRIHSINEDFFLHWNSKSAYVFGYWMADGYIHHNKHYKISFTSKDVGHLELVKKTVRSDTKLYHNLKRDDYELCLYSKKLFQQIMSLGGTPHKSTTLKFPNIPKRYLPDFIRGYFDGDGSVHRISYIASKNGKTYQEIRSNFTCGSRKFLVVLRMVLCSTLGLSNRVIGQYGPHQFKLGYGQGDTTRLLKFMYYPGHLLSLKRKAIFLNYVH